MNVKKSSEDNCIKSVTYDFENAYELNNSVGDTWCPVWAMDGNLYSSSCDGSGFDERANSNLCFHKITGDIVDDNHGLKGETINAMNKTGDHRWDYGLWAGKPNWKANGLTSIEGTLYLFVSLHGNEFYNEGDIQVTVQRAWNSSIIKSTDSGVTWFPSKEDNTENPMFSGNRFGSPFFIHYGQDGRPPKDNADLSNEYIYAVANDGYWNNGNNMILGRVKRIDISSLNPDKWEFYIGGEGTSDYSWTKNLNSGDVKEILLSPHKLSQASVTYIEHLGRYIMLQWYYNPKNPPVNAWGGVWYGWGGKTYLDTYEAPHPWGPWTKVNVDSVECELGWYNPVVINKFTTVIDENTIKTYVACAGDFAPPQTRYKMNLIPLLIKN